MNAESRRLRTKARQLARGKHPSQVRYPEAFRRAACALVRRRGGRGGSVGRLARELGVSEPTLTKWLRPPARPVLRPVAVTPPPTADSPVVLRPVLVTPRGVRVEGLDRAALVAVLQALG
jgi:transposase-like protein